MVNEYFKEFKEEVRAISSDDELLSVIEENLNPNVIANKSNYRAILDRWESKELHISIGNLKIGEDTGIFNNSSAHNCFSRKQGFCGECGKCYAFEEEEVYANVLMNNTINEYLMDNLPRKDIMSQFSAFYDANEDLLFHRWNSFGEFRDIETFDLCDGVSSMLYRDFGVLSYSYTHNPLLDVDILQTSDIVMNFSYDVQQKEGNGWYGIKKCIVVEPYELPKYVRDPNYYICLGNCSMCPVCKDPSDFRTVVFVRHGRGKPMHKQLKSYLDFNTLHELKAMTFIDNGHFLEDNRHHFYNGVSRGLYYLNGDINSKFRFHSYSKVLDLIRDYGYSHYEDGKEVFFITEDFFEICPSEELETLTEEENTLLRYLNFHMEYNGGYCFKQA